MRKRTARIKPSPRPYVPEKVILELISYNESEYLKEDHLTPDQLLSMLRAGLVNWINVDGLHDKAIIRAFATHFNLHSLLVEDVLGDHQPKAEEYDDYLFFTLKMLHRIDGTSVEYEQISFVLGKDYLISFQQKEGDPFDSLRDRLRLGQGRLRKYNADYLLYRLVDVIVDNYYVVLDNVGDNIEQIEERLYEAPGSEIFRRIQSIKKELIYLRKALFPLRDALSKLIKQDSDFIQQANIRFYADVYDHVVHLIDSLDTYKDLSSGLMDIYINTQNTRLNEIIKLLTVMSTIFIPLTFLVGVYGMNFDFMPELRWKWGYFTVWGVMAAAVAGMVGYFRYKKWF
jgi:magnesium transporter